MTVIIRTQEEFDALIKENAVVIDDNIEIHCNVETKIKIECGSILCFDGSVYYDISAGDIKARDINAGDINAGNIKAWNIKARDINAWNINAGDINAGDINARDINAWNIKAWDIKTSDINAGDIKAGSINAWNINAGDINAWNIKARDIDYYAVCFAYKDIKCTKIEAKRTPFKHFCLDGEIIIKGGK
jgi:hypothetical protein